IIVSVLLVGIIVYLSVSWLGLIPGVNQNKSGESVETEKEFSDLEDNSISKSKKYYEITGQVNSPGVYESTDKIMVIELISMAGGLTEQADLHKVHKDISLSALVEERQKIYIPALFEKDQKSSSSSSGSVGSISGKVSINSATSQELETLPDVGPATASKIISARPFS